MYTRGWTSRLVYNCFSSWFIYLYSFQSLIIWCIFHTLRTFRFWYFKRLSASVSQTKCVTSKVPFYIDEDEEAWVAKVQRESKKKVCIKSGMGGVCRLRSNMQTFQEIFWRKVHVEKGSAVRNKKFLFQMFKSFLVSGAKFTNLSWEAVKKVCPPWKSLKKITIHNSEHQI